MNDRAQVTGNSGFLHGLVFFAVVAYVSVLQGMSMATELGVDGMWWYAHASVYSVVLSLGNSALVVAIFISLKMVVNTVKNENPLGGDNE